MAGKGGEYGERMRNWLPVGRAGRNRRHLAGIFGWH
jgi:hypothetical protein